MKIGNSEFLELSSNSGKILLTIRGKEEEISGNSIIIDAGGIFKGKLLEYYIRIYRMKSLNLIKIIIYPNKKVYLNAVKAFKRFYKFDTEMLDATELAKKNWELLAEIGK